VKGLYVRATQKCYVCGREKQRVGRHKRRRTGK